MCYRDIVENYRNIECSFSFHSSIKRGGKINAQYIIGRWEKSLLLVRFVGESRKNSKDPSKVEELVFCIVNVLISLIQSKRGASFVKEYNLVCTVKKKRGLKNLVFCMFAIYERSK